VELSQDLRLQTEQVILEQIAELRENAGTERQQLVTRQRRALDERAKLLEAHYAGALPLDLLKSEQERLGSELNYIEERLGTLELKFDVVERNLKAALNFVGNIHAAYLQANPRIRRQINQALFERFLISDEGDIIGELRAPFDLLLQASGTADQDGHVRLDADGIDKPRGPRGPRGLSNEQLVELGGLEPPTSWVRSRRSPN
jgi:site-specific DNA recombinase